jgi:hypothetical protein
LRLDDDCKVAVVVRRVQPWPVALLLLLLRLLLVWLLVLLLLLPPEGRAAHGAHNLQRVARLQHVVCRCGGAVDARLAAPHGALDGCASGGSSRCVAGSAGVAVGRA